jgi:hypothetical protein
MRKSIVITAMLTLATVIGAQPAQAQGISTWNRDWVVGASAGAASLPSDTTLALGAAVNWGLTPRIGIEASSTWLRRPGTDEAVAVAITSQVAVWRREAVTAFARGGVGAFVMTLNTGDEIPEFYRARMASLPPGSTRAFTDPSVVIGAGVDLRMSRHLHLRPTVDFVTAVRDRRTMTVMMTAVQVAYHFETHRITPQRAGRR